MHTKDKLAAALTKAGLQDMAIKAAAGYYHDYLSPLDTPSLQLDADLVKAGTPAALAVRARHHNGEFDASREESEEWARSSEGRETFAALTETPKKHAQQQVGRLAMREEGDTWVAYYAMPGTMDGALVLGSIKMAIAANADRKQEFMALMKEAVADLIESQCGHRPVWPEPPQAAPEHERSGRA
jgi:hypothetical protein